MKTKRLLVALAAVMTTSSGVQAAGFALYENNASGLGTAFAGQAAVAQDASTIFFNPAGLTQIEGRQLVGALTYIHSTGEFSGDGYLNGVMPLSSLGLGDGGNGGVSSWVPGAFYAMDISPDFKFGIGVYAPFGLATEWDEDWVGRTQAIKSDVKTINVNPTLAWKVNDKLSIGAGINWQYIKAELSSFNPTGLTSGFEVELEGDDNSWGWNVGALFTLDAATRVGVSYRSEIEHELDGDADPMGASISAGITLPDMASLSLFRKLNPQWELLADVTWTGWSDFEKLEVPEIGYLVTEDWDDAWRFTLGFQYHANEKWTWRAGVAFDQTPVPDAEHRTARIPDEDRISVAIGAQYRLSKQTMLDFGYMHIFFDDADIKHCEPEQICTGAVAGNSIELDGRFDVSADIVGAQFTYNF